MRLHRVEIKNFRSIEYAKIEFEPRCRILVGMNDTGKSNALKALAILGDESSGTKSDRRQGVNGNDKDFYVNAVFSPDTNDWNELKTAMGMTMYNWDEHAKEIIEDLKNLNIKYQVTFYLSDIKAEKTIFPDVDIEDIVNKFEFDDSWMRKKENITRRDMSVGTYQQVHQQVKNFYLYDFVNQKDIVNVTDDAKNEVFDLVSDTKIKELIRSRIKQWITKDFKFIFWESDDSRHKMKDEVPFENFISEPSDFVFLNNLFKFNEYSENNKKNITNESIIQIINKYKSESTTSFQNYLNNVALNFSKYFEKVWGNYNYNTHDKKLDNFAFDLLFTNDKFCFSIVETTRDKERTLYPISFRGTGLKKFVEFLLAVSNEIDYNDISNTLFIIDEPETSLHHSASRDFRKELVKITEGTNNYVVYATHSMSMIDEDNFQRHYVVSRDNEVTEVVPADEVARNLHDEMKRKDKENNRKHYRNILENEILYSRLGHSIYYDLKKINIMFEGWTDKRLFKNYLDLLRKKTEDLEFGVSHAWGAKSFIFISPIVELAGKMLYIISDTDKTAKEEKKKYENFGGHAKWLTYTDIDQDITAMTAEDFIQGEYIVNKVSDYIKLNHQKLKIDNQFTVIDLEDKRLGKLRLARVKEWFNRNLYDTASDYFNKNSDEIKGSLEKIKNEIKFSIFNDLQANNIIDSEYKKLYNGIIKTIKAEENPSSLNQVGKIFKGLVQKKPAPTSPQNPSASKPISQ